MVKHTVGDTYWVVARFRDPSGQLVSPSTVTVNVRDPDDSTRSIVATEESEGVFLIGIPVLMPGIAYFSVEGEGTNVDAYDESSFCGVASSMAVV